MNTYFQSFIDKFEKVRSKEELTRTFEICCGGLKDEKGHEIVHGCNRQIACNELMCPVYKAYQVWYKIIDEVRRPTVVYVEGPKPATLVKHRKYKIKPSIQCAQIVNAQITKLLKHPDTNKEQALFIKELVNKKSLKRARIHANRAGFNKIVKTLDKFIGMAAK